MLSVLKTLSIESMHGYGIAQHIQMLSESLRHAGRHSRARPRVPHRRRGVNDDGSAIVSDRLWRTSLGADPAIVGQVYAPFQQGPGVTRVLQSFLFGVTPTDPTHSRPSPCY